MTTLTSVVELFELSIGGRWVMILSPLEELRSLKQQSSRVLS